MVQAHDRLVGGVLPGGLLLRGLSGGERKRLWVAVGIIATPSVVFLDGAGQPSPHMKRQPSPFDCFNSLKFIEKPS
jgi:hypothetical protein